MEGSLLKYVDFCCSPFGKRCVLCAVRLWGGAATNPPHFIPVFLGADS
jgi:hypothetical protein